MLAGEGLRLSRPGITYVHIEYNIWLILKHPHFNALYHASRIIDLLNTGLPVLLFPVL